MSTMTARHTVTADVDYDENSHKTVAELELRRYNSIVEQHGDQLEEIIEALGPHPLPPWDPYLDPVKLKMTPFEQTSLVQLIHADNKLVNKVVLALSAVCLEASQLVEEARHQLYPPLVLYGSGVGEEGETTGESQASLSRILPTLHQVACYVRRVQKVSRNIMHQMTSLYTAEKKLSRMIDVSDVHFQLEQSSSEGWWCDYQPQVVGVTALGILHQVIFNTQDKKLARTLINILKKVCGWAVNLDVASKKHSSHMKNQDLSQRASLLLQGMILAHSIKYSIETVLNLHTTLGRPMGKDEDMSSLLVLLRRLDLACEVQSRVSEATNCPILYHHRVILPAYLDQCFQSFDHVHHIHV